MTEELARLLEMAKRVEMTPAQAEEQRRSFAFGNTNLENPTITWETVTRVAENLKKEP